MNRLDPRSKYASWNRLCDMGPPAAGEPEWRNESG
jgi:hypothetical protein